MRKYFFLLATSLFVLAAAEIKEKVFTPQQKRWWAFQPVQKSPVPSVKNTAWVKNPIDAFILAKLEEKGIKPNPRADNLTLLRRASIDLTGLPPTPEEVQALVSDTAPDAFDKAIDRLLASPRYGERWARHWLDLARYADSEGFKSDETRPHVWRYRDYVIKSLNDDKPYDLFVKEQIAGDELYPHNPDALVATGFNRHFPDESNARNLMQRRQELMFDIVDTVGSTFMGLTYGCAKCHDHKFDPILHKDYYRLQAYFANTRIEDNAVLEMGPQRTAWQKQHDEWDAKTSDIRKGMAKLAEPGIAKLDKENFDKFPEEIQDAITTTPEKRTPIQWHMYYKAKPQIGHTEEEGSKRLRGEEAKQYAELKSQLKTFDPIKPHELPVAQAMIDNGRLSPKTHVLGVGVYDAYKEEVQPGVLSILDPSDMKIVPPAAVESSGRRSALANWLTDPKNPLTARVMSNRIWHYHFGRGIVATPSDFGVMGERPTNKELLDYMTASFVEGGWSMKKMHKTILTSNTWQQSSAFQEEAAKIDPDNKYQWRFNRQRMEGEVIRDSMLYTAGRLNAKMGGPGVFPPLPPGVDPRGGWKKNEETSEADRRSVYVFVRRNVRYPMFETFDMPDTHESCSRRNSTITSNQALDLLNNGLVFDWSKTFADRVLNDGGMSPEAQIDRAYKLAYARPATADERRTAIAFLEKQSPIAGDRKAAFADLCHMLFNSNEFLYVN